MGNTEVIFCRGSLWLCRILIISWRKDKGKKRNDHTDEKTGCTNHTVRNKSGTIWQQHEYPGENPESFWWESQVYIQSVGQVLYWLNFLFVKHMRHSIKSYLLSNSFGYFMWNGCNERKWYINIYGLRQEKQGFWITSFNLTLGESFNLSEPVSLFVKLIP